MLALRRSARGDDEYTFAVAHVPDPSTPGDREAQIVLEYSPIYPDDLRAGAETPDGPLGSQVGGKEAVGLVSSVGKAVRSVRPGDRVSVGLIGGIWCERLNVAADQLLVLPAGLDPRLGAWLRGPPATAYALLTRYADLKPGDWIAQNDGGSSIGRSVIALARDRGLRTFSYVSDPADVHAVRDAGGDLAIAQLDGRPRLALDAQPIVLAIDGVGGASAFELIRLLSPRGKFVGYSQRSGSNMPAVDLRAIMKSGIAFDFLDSDAAVVGAGHHHEFGHIARLMASGALSFSYGAQYPLESFEKAIAEVRTGAAVLLDLRPKPIR
jgi:NADPH:quinone reductase-like Zn-dependent oxidoreductase